MKKFLLSFLFIVICNNMIFADSEPIVIHNNGIEDDRHGNQALADMPAVFYDADTEQIIVDGCGVVSYYDVEIISQSTMMTVVSTVVNGYYGIIDVSSVPAGDYTIVITSPNNNVYEGDFSVY